MLDLFESACVTCVIRKICSKKAWDHLRSHPHEPLGPRGTEAGATGLTVGAQQALKLGEQPDGVELPQEAVVVQAVPQLDDEAADESSQLWGQALPHPMAGTLGPSSSASSL